jgi:hypothetical protein
LFVKAAFNECMGYAKFDNIFRKPEPESSSLDSEKVLITPSKPSDIALKLQNNCLPNNINSRLKPAIDKNGKEKRRFVFNA